MIYFDNMCVVNDECYAVQCKVVIFVFLKNIIKNFIDFGLKNAGTAHQIGE